MINLSTALPHLVSERSRKIAGPYLGMLIFGLVGTLGVFNGGAWASIGILGGVLALFATKMRDGSWPRPDVELTRFISAFLLLLVFINFEATYAGLSWIATLERVSVLLPLLVLSSPAVRKNIAFDGLFKWGPWVLAIVTFLFAIELKFNLPLAHLFHGDHVKEATKYNRGFSYVMMMAWPAAACLWLQGKRWSLLLFAALFVPALVLTFSRATQMGVALGAFVFVVACLMPRITMYVLGALALVFSFWGFGASYLYIHAPEWVAHLPASWLHRVEIWDYMNYHILEKPWLGWGLGASHLLPVAGPNAGSYVLAQSPVAHPHNVFIELWVELGVCGLLVGVQFVSLTLRWIHRSPLVLQPFMLAYWAGGLTLCLCAYDFWTDSFHAMFALTALFFVMVKDEVLNKGALQQAKS